MKRTKIILSFIITLLFSSVMAFAAGPVAGAAVFALSLFDRVVPVGSLMAGVTPEIWVNYIVENLFKNNEFMLSSIDESQYVVGGSVVHIPQAGSTSGVKRNRKELPATITRRKDVDVTYALDEFTTDPRFIPDIDKAELSYDKMNSCMSEDMAYLQQFVAEAMLYNWRPDHFIKTTGSSTAAHIGTGNRKAVTLSDFRAAKTQFNKWNIPKDGRNVVIDTEMFDQLCADLQATSTRDYSAIYDAKTGRLDMLEGFKIYERSTALVASNATVSAVTGTKYFDWTSTDLTYTPEGFADIEAGDVSAATTACAIAMFWSNIVVARAVGATKMFDDQGNPQFYGDIYSFLQRAGGRKRRADGKGVLGLIQVAA